MQIDNETLKKIASMSDGDLKKFISATAAESGISLPGISADDLGKIRALLGGVSAGDPAITRAIERASESVKRSDGKQ